MKRWAMIAVILFLATASRAEVPEQYRDLLNKVYNSQASQASTLDARAAELKKTLRQFDQGTSAIQRQKLLQERQINIGDLTRRAKSIRAHESVEFPTTDILEQGGIGKPPDIIRSPMALRVNGSSILAQFTYTVEEVTDSGRESRFITRAATRPVEKSGTVTIKYLQPQTCLPGEGIQLPSLIEVSAPGPNAVLTELDWDHASPFWQEFVKSMAAKPAKAK